jgi:hypothetical protein
MSADVSIPDSQPNWCLRSVSCTSFDGVQPREFDSNIKASDWEVTAAKKWSPGMSTSKFLRPLRS